MSTGLRDRLPLFKSTVRVVRARASTPQPDVVPDRYECEEELGKGGMGRVERGLDRYLGRTVALKRSLTDEPHMLQLLLREAEIASRLNHPSIITIHDVARDDEDKPFVVMRLVDGRRLSEIVGECEGLPARLRLLPRVATAIDAIAYAHAQGVVHRDLKPDNILLGQHGETVVIDWGLSHDRRDTDDPFVGQTVGTSGFMSPEQERGESVDARTDVYALGVTLYCVLSGKPPDVREVVPGMPHDLLAIITKATASDAANRYPSAHELASDLQRFIGGQLVAAHHYGLGQRFARWVRKHRALVAISSVALVTSAVIGVVSIRGMLAARGVAERERKAAVERADQLIVDRAREAVQLDPPRALALLDLRSTRELDAAAWAVAVEAVARGVPRVWNPNPNNIVASIVALGKGRVASMDRKGNLAFRSGDGTVRTIASYGASSYIDPVTGGFVASTGGRVELFDNDGTSIRSWTDVGPKTQVTTGGRWITLRWHPTPVFRNVDDGTTRESAVEPKASIAIAPTGKWAAIVGDDALHILELATGVTLALTPVPSGLQWSPSGQRLLGTTMDSLIEWDATDWKKAPRLWRQPPSLPTYLGEQAASISLGGCVNVASTMARDPLKCYANSIQGFAVNAAGLAITDGRIVDLYPTYPSHDAWWIQLAGVPGNSWRVAISDDLREIVTSAHNGQIVFWDLATRSVEIDDSELQHLVMIGSRIFYMVASTLYEIERHDRKKVGSVPVTGTRRDFVVAGTHVLFIGDEGNIYEVGEKPVLVASGIGAMSERGTSELVIADMQNRIGILNLETKQITIVATHEAKVSAVAASATAIGGAWIDGYVWWRDKTGDHTANVGCEVTLVLFHDDALEVACGPQILRVSARGEITPLATLPQPVTTWTTPDHDGPRAIVTVDSAVWRLDGKQLSKLELGGTKVRVAVANDRFATANQVTGQIHVYDLATGARAEVGTLRAPFGIVMAPDGRSLVVRSARKILRWYDPTPRDPAAWPAWKASVTTATLRDPNATLEWR